MHDSLFIEINKSDSDHDSLACCCCNVCMGPGTDRNHSESNHSRLACAYMQLFQNGSKQIQNWTCKMYM